MNGGEYDTLEFTPVPPVKQGFFKPLKKVCFQTEILGNLFKYIFFVLFFCLLFHRIAARISLPLHIFLQVLIIVLIPSSETQGRSVGSGEKARRKPFQVRAPLFSHPTDCPWVSEDELIQVYKWEIRHHSLVCCCGLADILYNW